MVSDAGSTYSAPVPDDSAKASSAAGKGRPSQSAPDRDPDEPKRFTTDELVEQSHGLLDVSPHAVAGALSDSTRETHTLAQAEDAVNKFLKRPVGE